MKVLINKLINRIAALIIAGSLFSCSSFVDLEPLDRRVEDNFYKTERDAMEALVAVYDVLQYNTVMGFHPVPMLMDIASDDSYAGGSSRTDAPNIIEIDQFRIRPTNNEIYGLWKKNYMGIYRANILLERIEGVEASETFKSTLKAEAKFLRAYFYLDLVRVYENVPLVTQVITNPDEYAQPQANTEDVYNQIAKDLEEAIEVLPARLLRANQGRATKWAAKALLARAYLFYNGVYNRDMNAGSVVVNRARALQHLEDIINESGHGLLSNYANLFRRAHEFSIESVFEISYSDLNPWFDWGYIQGGDGNIAAQMQGPRLKDPGKENYESGWSFAPVTQNLYDAFEANDPRREHTILSETEFNAEITIGFQHTGYFSKKYTTSKDYKPSAGQQELNWGNNYRVIRYADVLLMAAELHSANGAVGSAQPYLDAVRARVELPSRPATLENIKAERRVELALEGHRYWDLLRWKQAEVISQSGVRGSRYQGDQADFNISFAPATKGFFPIPQSEIDLTRNKIKQNSGY
jgi:starch-binding outer membrane protein, SusD/RagB family